MPDSLGLPRLSDDSVSKAVLWSEPAYPQKKPEQNLEYLWVLLCRLMVCNGTLHKDMWTLWSTVARALAVACR